MFSFIKKCAETLNGAGIYRDIGLILFGVVFLAAVLFAFKVSKKYVADMSEMPLNDSPKN